VGGSYSGDKINIGMASSNSHARECRDSGKRRKTYCTNDEHFFDRPFSHMQ
jgi:hypothetical protein